MCFPLRRLSLENSSVSSVLFHILLRRLRWIVESLHGVCFPRGRFFLREQFSELRVLLNSSLSAPADCRVSVQSMLLSCKASSSRIAQRALFYFTCSSIISSETQSLCAEYASISGGFPLENSSSSHILLFILHALFSVVLMVSIAAA